MIGVVGHNTCRADVAGEDGGVGLGVANAAAGGIAAKDEEVLIEGEADAAGYAACSLGAGEVGALGDLDFLARGCSVEGILEVVVSGGPAEAVTAGDGFINIKDALLFVDTEIDGADFSRIAGEVGGFGIGAVVADIEGG